MNTVFIYSEETILDSDFQIVATNIVIVGHKFMTICYSSYSKLILLSNLRMGQMIWVGYTEPCVLEWGEMQG